MPARIRSSCGQGASTLKSLDPYVSRMGGQSPQVTEIAAGHHPPRLR